MQGLFCVRQSDYNLRNPNHLAIPSINSVYRSSESVSNPKARIWNIVPNRIKELNITSSFKNEIKNFQPEICLCKLCKTFLWFFVISYKEHDLMFILVSLC